MTDPIAPSRLEGLVLSSIRTADDLALASRCGVTSQHFVTEAHERAWNYLNDKVSEGAEMPSLADLQAFGVEVVEGVTDVETWSEQLVTEVLGLRINSALLDIVKQRRTETDPRGALSTLLKDLTDLSEIGTETDVLYADADAEQILEDVRSRSVLQERGESIGLMTGLAIFDDDGWHWQEGEVVGIMGASGIGKSSLMTYLCAVTYLQGARILFLSPESTRKQVIERSHIYLSRLDGRSFRQEELRKGTVDLEGYEDFTKQLSTRKDWAVVDAGSRGAFTIEEVLSLAREHKPTVLAIDGFHLMLPEHGRQPRWEQVQEAAARLKGLAQHTGMLVFAVGQTVREANQFDDDLPESHHAAYGFKALLEAADRTLTLARRGNQPKLKRFGVEKFRNGPDLKGQEKILEFDPDVGLIKQQ